MLVAKAIVLIVLAVNEGLSPSFIDLRNGLIDIHARRTAVLGGQTNPGCRTTQDPQPESRGDAFLSRVKEPISVFLEARVWAIIFVEPNANGAKQRK